MASGHIIASMLQKIVGTGTGSGMAAMFLCTGILGASSSCFEYRDKYIQKLRNEIRCGDFGKGKSDAFDIEGR